MTTTADTDVTRGLNRNSAPQPWICNMWANINRSGHANEFHSHPGAYWSCVYYVDDGGIGERRRVAQVAEIVLGDLAQDAAHDLARARLGQAGRPLDGVGRGDRADLLAHPCHQFLAQFLAGIEPGIQGDVGVDALALDVVREADNGRLGDQLVRHQRALDFGGSDAMARDVDHVIDAAGDPVVAVLVAAAAVAGARFSSGMKTISRLAQRMVPARK